MKNIKTLTIVMYHYIRDLKHSRFPNIKGLDIFLFKEQLAYINKHYNIISMEQLIDAIDNNTLLPPKSLLLTFDDAYIDHFLYVFPLLDKLKIQGSFFPPVKAIVEHKVLDVNKIHFILASGLSINKIITEIFHLLNKYSDKYKLYKGDYYFNKLAKKSRFDTKEVIFIKRLLQRELDVDVRGEIINELFNKFVGIEEDSFSRELYMNKEQIKCMNRNGMHIGNHGYEHFWLNSLSYSEQENEIDKSLAFIKEIEGDIKKWTMCYPYGAYNSETINIIKKKGCKVGLTTEVRIANLSKHTRYELPRLDTNDLPKDKSALVNLWYNKG